MNANVSFYLRNYKKSDGTSPINLLITHANQKKYLSLNLSIQAKDWDNKKNIAKASNPDFKI